MTQFVLDLPHRAALGRADFLASDSNAAALAMIERWPDWPGNAVVVYGPAGCGKTHLGRLWRARSGGELVRGQDLTSASVGNSPAAAIAVDDAHEAPERVLLHLYNAHSERGDHLLLLMPQAPATSAIALPDLASRLRALPAIGVAPPDDALLAAVLVKHFTDRQLRVEPRVIEYLVPRIERSFAAAASVVSALDQRSLSRGGAVTVPLARELLAELGAQSSISSDFGVT